MTNMILEICVVAVVANVITDIYELALERGLGKSRDWHLVGRWVNGLTKGQMALSSTDEDGAVGGELALGWIFHYAVGLIYAAFFLVLVDAVFDGVATLSTAVGFGAVTVVAPWFILMPALGAGPFAINAARPTFARLSSLSVHAVYGLGLYVGVVFFQQLSI